MTDANSPRPENSGDLSVQSVPLDTEDGGQVVIEQQNMGGDRQVGGGEFKDGERAKTPDEAAEEQAELEADAPVDEDQQQSDSDSTR